MIFHDDFEAADDRGWTHAAFAKGLGDPWVHGASKNPACGQGTRCWATSLDGNYLACQEAALTSPVLDLSACAVGAKVRVSFAQWFQFEGFAENSYFDGGFIQISKDGGLTWAVLPLPGPDPPYLGRSGVSDNACMSVLDPLKGKMIWSDKKTAAWKPASFAVPADFMTKSFRVRLVFGADNHDFARGWLIDDFAVEVL